MRSRISQTVTYWGYFLAWRILGYLPEKFLHTLGSTVSHYFLGKSGRLRSNLKMIVGDIADEDLDHLHRAGMRSYIRYWLDTFRFSRWSRERILSTVEIFDEHLLRDELKKNKGAIVAIPHSGNWDHAGAYFSLTGAPVVTVAERLEPEKLFMRFLSHRTAMGMEVLPLDARVSAYLAQRLRHGRLVALVADRDMTSRGISVNFAGREAKFPGGPARLSIQTGAPLLTAHVSYTQNGIRIDFDPVIPVPEQGSTDEKIAEMTQEVAERFYHRIRKKPEDWHMLQRIWVES
jgi:phosphatidylinositol dimannoside acyltransferase